MVTVSPGLATVLLPAAQLSSLMSTLASITELLLAAHCQVSESMFSIGMPDSQLKPAPSPRINNALPKPMSHLAIIVVLAFLTVFLAVFLGAFLVAVFLTVAFLTTVFLVAAFLVAAFLAEVFFVVVFFVAMFVFMLERAIQYRTYDCMNLQ